MMNITNIVDTNVIHPMFFQWDRKALIQNTEFVTLNMEGNYYNDSIMNISRYGTVKLSVRYHTVYKYI